jgi:hypothetical protein
VQRTVSREDIQQVVHHDSYARCNQDAMEMLNHRIVGTRVMKLMYDGLQFARPQCRQARWTATCAALMLSSAAATKASGADNVRTAVSTGSRVVMLPSCPMKLNGSTSSAKERRGYHPMVP